MTPEDMERAEKALHIGLRIVASQLIMKHTNIKEIGDPYQLKPDMIEYNGTTRKKTVRLLRERYGVNEYTMREKYSSKKYLHFGSVYKEYSNDIKAPDSFRNTPEELKDIWFEHRQDSKIRDEEELTKLGFIKLFNLPLNEVFYVQKNIENFNVFLERDIYSWTKKVPLYVYPKDLEENRKENIAVFLFILKAERMLKGWLENRYSINLDKLDFYPKDNENRYASIRHKYTIELPSYQSLPCLFQERFFTGGEGRNFKEKYGSTLLFYMESIKNLKKLLKGIEADGGYESVMRAFFEYAKEKIIENAVLNLSDEPDVAHHLLSNGLALTYEKVFNRRYK